MHPKTKKLTGMWSSFVGGSIGRNLANNTGGREGRKTMGIRNFIVRRCQVRKKEKILEAHLPALHTPPPSNAYELNATSNDRRASVCQSSVC